MSLSVCAGGAAIAAVVLLIVLVVAIVLVRRGQGAVCPHCGAAILRKSPSCPACGRSIQSAQGRYGGLPLSEGGQGGLPQQEGRQGSQSTAAPGSGSDSAAEALGGKGASQRLALLFQPDGEGQQASSVELVVTRGPLASQRFPITAQGLSIGRHPDNDVVLADEMMVSRHHAVIVREQGQYVLYDKDSANGTWVNEQRVFRHVLAPGDRIQIWRSQFVLSLPGASPPPPAPSAPRPAAAHVVGEYLDGYRLDSLLGRGGMSEVFKGVDPDGQTVAIKILQETNPYLVEKFVQEGNQIGPILRGHPNIVVVHRFGQSQDGRLYLVMEFVGGLPLRKMLVRPLSPPQVVSVVGQVCNALAFAHQNNIVHRDIKPENILITRDGVAKVLDFGIAKLTSAATVTTDAIIGTPEYISPEQARGEPVQPASDIYSLGVVLYEILTGSVPFRRPRCDDPHKAAMEVIRQHLHERPEPIRKRNPNAHVPAQLERVTMRSLEKNLKQRYATAKDMGLALGYSKVAVPQPAPTHPSAVCLTVLQGPRQGQQILLSPAGLRLGRAQLGSSNPAISREHADVFFRGGSYWLQDISKNGTYVNRQRVYGEIPLPSGAIIIIGDNVLRLDQRQ